MKNPKYMREWGNVVLPGDVETVGPVTECRLVPKWAGQFDTHADWINCAHLKLTGAVGSMGQVVPAICVDSLGRRCHIGADFMRAERDNAYPVRFFWEMQTS